MKYFLIERRKNNESIVMMEMVKVLYDCEWGIGESIILLKKIIVNDVLVKVLCNCEWVIG